jgi:hypothetical protein
MMGRGDDNSRVDLYATINNPSYHPSQEQLIENHQD